MQDLIRRLIDCGMSRTVALYMLRKIPGLRDREHYVEQIEEASHEQMEAI